MSDGQSARVNQTRIVRRTVRKIQHVEFLEQSAGQSLRVDRARIARRTVWLNLTGKQPIKLKNSRIFAFLR